MAEDNEPIRRIGLENVIVADSELSYIDGAAPLLVYRGYDIQDLAAHSSYEETAYLLWNGELPTQSELDAFRDELAARRPISDETVDMIAGADDDAVPMEVLRTAVSALPIYGEDEETSRDEGLAIIAKIPTIMAAYERLRNGEDPVDPHPDLDTAANFLYMMTGEEPDPGHADVLDTALLLHADHGINASTFTARVISSTESDLFSAIVGAIAALKGPLHGGANQEVMEMLLDVADDDRTTIDYVADLLDRGERVPGFGHRVYEAMDPRAEVLKDIAGDLTKGGEGPDWFGMLTDIEDYLREEKNIEEKGIAPNVDLYSGSVYYSLGIPIDFFVPMFAMGRSVGWIAQVLEQYADNRLMRPRAEYVGERDLEYVPIEDR